MEWLKVGWLAYRAEGEPELVAQGHGEAAHQTGRQRWQRFSRRTYCKAFLSWATLDYGRMPWRNIENGSSHSHLRLWVLQEWVSHIPVHPVLKDVRTRPLLSFGQLYPHVHTWKWALLLCNRNQRESWSCTPSQISSQMPPESFHAGMRLCCMNSKHNHTSPSL